MSYALCNLSLVAMRAEPSHRAEMVSQLLFGELFSIREEKGDWLCICSDYDGYTGWIDYKQCRPVSDEFVEKYQSSPSPLSYELMQIVFNQSRNIAVPVLLGSTLPNMVNKVFYIDDDRYYFEGNVVHPGDESRKFRCDTAMQYLHSPYLWGGRSPVGIDCSGLVQMVYKICGFRMPRDAAQQSKQGSLVSFITEAMPGDLAFFENEAGEIVHTGIILQGQKIIHASGRVRIDTIDHEGIYNAEMKKYTHKLRIIKSIF